MDFKIENGDWLLNQCGLPVELNGYREIFERCRRCLEVPLGSFVYDKNFGSQLHRLADYETGASENQAMLFAQKALQNINCVRVLNCKLSQSDGKVSKAVFTLEYNGTNQEVTVNIDNGKII